jgi:hypothetical protein
VLSDNFVSQPKEYRRIKRLIRIREGKAQMGPNKDAGTNFVFEKCAEKKVKLTVRHLDRTMILIEGHPDAHRFLGELLLTFAHSKEHSVQFSPHGAGNRRFTKSSTLGIYLHKLPDDTPGTRALKGSLANKKDKRMSFSEIRKVAAKAARNQ